MENIIFSKDKILELCKGKDVLHLGFVQHHDYENRIAEDDWLHSKIASVCKTLVGFDYLKDEVNNIQDKYGYKAYFADVMNLQDVAINQTFDVIICGELIGHIENAGLMLDGIKRFMKADESILIITTPNLWSQTRIKLIESNKTDNLWINDELVAWYSFGTLSHLLERKGFVEYFYDYYNGQNHFDIYKNTKGLIGKFKILKRRLILALDRKQCQDGLFFVSKLSK
jgi:hypothetical protein